MDYQTICQRMRKAGWEGHLTLCLKHLTTPGFTRERRPFCTVGKIRQLDTHRLYEETGRAPETADWAGEAVALMVSEPGPGGSTRNRTLHGWIHREEIFALKHPLGDILFLALSDVQHRLPAE